MLNAEFADEYARFLQARTTARVVQRIFDKSTHAMAVVTEPELYKKQHVDDLLSLVPEWRVES